MTMGLRFLSLLILSLAVTRALAVEQVYCHVEDNEYYVRQWGKCKACDRCPHGYGLNSKRTVELDPVYGAVQCRDCVKCTPGETFKSTIGYDECQSCTNCTGLGQRVGTACSTVADAVCREIPQERPPANLQQNQQELEVSDVHKQVRQKEKENTGMNLFTTITGIVVMVILVPTMAALLVLFRKKLPDCRKRGLKNVLPCEIKIVYNVLVFLGYSKLCIIDRNQPKDVEEQRSLNDQLTNENLATLETAVESAPLNNEAVSSPSFGRPPSMQSEDFPPLASNFSFDLTNYGGKDIEMDTAPLTHLRSQETPSDRELQGLCTSIAHQNLYAKLGRELGVNDNEIQRIKEEQKHDLQETAFQTLKKWRELKGTGATKSVLRQALNTIGLNHVKLKDDP